MRDTEASQREKQAPCGEPHAGLNPRTPGSCSEPKADFQLLSHPGASSMASLIYEGGSVHPSHSGTQVF